MKYRWIIALLIVSACVLAISVGAQEKKAAQAAEDTIIGTPQEQSGNAANPPSQSQSLLGSQDTKPYPEQLQAVLSAMTAELGEIAQAAQQGNITRNQAEYLSLERYYVALTRFQFLRTLYAEAAPSNDNESRSQSNAAAAHLSPQALIVPPLTCLNGIPEQTVSYLELKPPQVDAIQAEITAECKQVQPLRQRLEKSRRKLISTRLSGKPDPEEVRALAAEQSRIIKQLIVSNSQLETRLYTMLTTEQQRKVDGLLRQALDSEMQLLPLE